jgi:hypothetical protein
LALARAVLRGVPLQAICFCRYLVEIGSGWRSDDFNAHDFVHAIKDHDIRGYAYVPLRGEWQRFDNSNRQVVVEWFGTMVADYFRGERLRITPPLAAFVPIPGSRFDTSCRDYPRTTALAEAVARALGHAAVEDIFRWKTVMPSANAFGGTRDPHALFENLSMLRPSSHSEVVLLDDVLTSGGHIQACAARLREVGVDVTRAVCAACSSTIRPAAPFEPHVVEIPDWAPPQHSVLVSGDL